MLLSFSFPTLGGDDEMDLSDYEITMDNLDDFDEEDEEDENEEEIVKSMGVVRRISINEECKVMVGVQVRGDPKKIAQLEETWLTLILDEM